MKQFNYHGDGVLSFEHQGQTFTINNLDTNLLPADSPLVLSLISQGLLTAV